MAGVQGSGSRSGGAVVATVGVVTTLVVIVGGLVLVATRLWLPGIPDCSATSGDRTVGLSTDDAERGGRGGGQVRTPQRLPAAWPPPPSRAWSTSPTLTRAWWPQR